MSKDRNKEREEEMSDYVFGKTQPQSPECEEAVLAGLMLDKEAFAEVDGIITDASDFYADKNGMIWNACVSLKMKGAPIDLLTVAEEMKLQGTLDKIGGGYALVDITQRVGSLANIVWHAYTVKSKAIKRNAIKMGLSMVRSGYEEEKTADEMIADAEKIVTQLAGGVVVGKDDDMAQMMVDEMLRIEEASKKPDGITGVPTGFRDLDAATGGWQDTDLIIIAARPAMGKSSLAIALAEGAASKDFPVGIFSLEMSKSQLVSRIVSIKSGVATNKIRRGKMFEHEWQQVHSSMEASSGLSIRIDDTPGIPITQLKAKARRWKRQFGIKIILIDYLQLITTTANKGANREQEISLISRELKSLAKELEIPVIALSQLSRSVETRGGTKRPQLSDLRECLATETSLVYTKNNALTNSNSLTNILSLHKNKLSEMDSDNIPKTKNVVFRLKTGTGRFVDATANHPILTSDGYKKMADIRIDDAIAVACGWSDGSGRRIDEAKFIGWMIGNGSMVGYASPTFITPDEEVSDSFLFYIEKRWGFLPKRHKHWSGDNVYQWDITKDSVRVSGGNPVRNWLKEMDLWGRKGPEKVIPKWFMEEADTQSILDVIAGLWETDGSISIGKKRSVISYSTTSLNLARQILYLLAKIGIIAHLDNGHLSSIAKHKCYKVMIGSSDQMRKFASVVKLTGRKGVRLSSLNFSDRQSYSSDVIGRATTLSIADDIRSQGITKRIIQTHGARRLTKRGLINALIECPVLKEKYGWAASDHIFWDSIDSITEVGEVDVFDRSVPVSNNFVVNGIIVHNSGAIEQDGDIVSFIYRPEYYNILEDEEGRSLKGVAEIIIAKHRNGPVGTEKLHFDAETTKFTDLEIFNPDPPVNIPHPDTKVESGIRKEAPVTPSPRDEDQDLPF